MNVPKVESIKSPKRRGRKPKGGKIINVDDNNKVIRKPTQNIILHLKCLESDIVNNTLITCNSYVPNVEDVNTYQFNQIKHNNLNSLDLTITNQHCDSLKNNDCVEIYDQNSKTLTDDYVHVKDKEFINNDRNIVWKKLRELASNLHVNNISDKRSSCFWCTYEFDNPCIHIPKLQLNDTYHCYGCFCSPECACAYLFKENIDSAIRFERYHMLNHIYCKIYNYEKNIKPAPNPFYTLEKYCGNLSIHEYRNMINKESVLLVIDKPLTRVLPELHEDNDDNMLHNNRKITSSNKFALNSRQTISKADILVENFNFK